MRGRIVNNSNEPNRVAREQMIDGSQRTEKAHLKKRKLVNARKVTGIGYEGAKSAFIENYDSGYKTSGRQSLQRINPKFRSTKTRSDTSSLISSLFESGQNRTVDNRRKNGNLR